jgi:hypothetical protein
MLAVAAAAVAAGAPPPLRWLDATTLATVRPFPSLTGTE